MNRIVTRVVIAIILVMIIAVVAKKYGNRHSAIAPAVEPLPSATHLVAPSQQEHTPPTQHQ